MWPLLPIPIPGFTGWQTVIQIPVHGIAVGLGLLLALLLIRKRLAPDARRFFPLLLVSGLLAGLVGARLAYLAFYGADRGLLGLDGGMVLLGGALTAFLCLLIIAHRQRLDLRRLADACLPPLLLALAIGRLGCWANGCCFGSPSELPWSHAMPAQVQSLAVEAGELRWHEEPSYAAWRCQQLGADIHQPRHPVQLYEALAALILALVLLPARRPGVNAALALLGYGLWRFAIEYLRGDKPSPTLLSDSQWMSLILLLSGCCILLIRAPGIASTTDDLPSRAQEPIDGDDGE